MTVHPFLRFALLAAWLTLAAGPSSAKPPAAPPAPPPDGAVVFRETCGRCHHPRSPDELSPARWEVVLQHMRTRAMLPARDIEAIRLFLAPPPPSVPRDFVSEARGAFPKIPQIAATCVRCHDVERIQAAVASGRQLPLWVMTLRRMQQYGAGLAPTQEQELAAALTALLPPPAPNSGTATPPAGE